MSTVSNNTNNGNELFLVLNNGPKTALHVSSTKDEATVLMRWHHVNEERAAQVGHRPGFFLDTTYGLGVLVGEDNELHAESRQMVIVESCKLVEQTLGLLTANAETVGG